MKTEERVKPYRLIFTKLTDVLTTKETLERAVDTQTGESWRLPFLFDHDCCRRLGQFCDSDLYNEGPQTKIVFTTSYRYLPNFSGMMLYRLKKFGFTKPMILPLQEINDNRDVGTMVAQFIRKNERWIHRWAVIETQPVDVHPGRPDRYVMVDDGLQEHHVERLQKLLCVTPCAAKIPLSNPNAGSFYGM